MGAWRGEDTRGLAVNLLNQFRGRLSAVRVDCVGIGHNFANHLMDCRFPVEFVNVGMACESKPQMGANDPARRFANLKACYYQTLADGFEKDQVEGLTDEATLGQLAGILYEIDSQGRLHIESKPQARARGVASPDRAEALMLALCKPPVKYEYLPVRTRSRFTTGVDGLRRSGSSCDYPTHDDDLDDARNVMRRRSRWDAWAGPLRWPEGRGY